MDNKLDYSKFVGVKITLCKWQEQDFLPIKYVRTPGEIPMKIPVPCTSTTDRPDEILVSERFLEKLKEATTLLKDK